MFCFIIYCSWFFRGIFSDSKSFSFNVFDYYLKFETYFLNYSIFYSYYSSFLYPFNSLFWSCFIFKRLFFYYYKFYNYVFKYFNSSSFTINDRLLYIDYSCLLIVWILFFKLNTYNCCFFNYIFLDFVVSSSSPYAGAYFFFLPCYFPII